MEEKEKKENCTKKAVFAGGCFWCMEAAFELLPGVCDAVSGYTGGKKENPTYEEVCRGDTGHVEAVQVLYNPEKVSYEKLLDIFWKSIDPSDDEGQFADRGSSYKTAIFYSNEKEKKLAEKTKKQLEKSGKFDKPIVTKILPQNIFYNAEEHHQGYSKKHKFQYKLYEIGSGRKNFIKRTWEIK